VIGGLVVIQLSHRMESWVSRVRSERFRRRFVVDLLGECRLLVSQHGGSDVMGDGCYLI